MYLSWSWGFVLTLCWKKVHKVNDWHLEPSPYVDSLSCGIHCHIVGPVSPHGSQNKPYSRHLLDVAMAPGEGWRNWPPGVVAQCQGHWRVVRATRKNPSLRKGKGVIFAISNEQLFLPHWSGVHPWGNFGLTVAFCFKQKEKKKKPCCRLGVSFSPLHLKKACRVYELEVNYWSKRIRTTACIWDNKEEASMQGPGCRIEDEDNSCILNIAASWYNHTVESKHLKLNLKIIEGRI